MKPKFKAGDVLQLVEKGKDYVTKLKILKTQDTLYLVQSLEENRVVKDASNVGRHFSRSIKDVDAYFILDSTYQATQTFDKELEDLLND